MPYPPRPQLRPLPEFAGTASPRPDPAVQARVEAFIVKQYTAGRSLRELAELTDRSFSAVRNILARHGVHRRGTGGCGRAGAWHLTAFVLCSPTPGAPHIRTSGGAPGVQFVGPRGPISRPRGRSSASAGR